MFKKAFICHYTKLIDRKQNINNQFNNIDIKYSIVEEFDQEQIDKTLYEENFNETTEFKISKKVFVSDNSPEMLKKMNKGELSIALKQKEVMKKISVDNGSGDEDYFFIFEDDIQFKKPLEKASEALKFLIKNNIKHDIVFFGEASLLKNRDDEFVFKKEHPATNGLCTYVIKKIAAKKLYEDLQKEKICFPIDHEFNYRFFKNNFEVFWATPITKHGSINGTFASTLR